jgi:hypothetical protein
MTHPPEATGFKAERRPDNGACVSYDPIRLRFVVEDCHGHEHGAKRRLEDARALAATLPGTPWVPPEPRRVSVSHRAHPDIKSRADVKVEDPR